jgi:hypothetical protein
MWFIRDFLAELALPSPSLVMLGFHMGLHVLFRFDGVTLFHINSRGGLKYL